MRGTIAPKSLTYEDVLEWGRRAFAVMKERGISIHANSIRPVLVELEAPFKSETLIQSRFHKSFPEFRQDVEEHTKRRAAANVVDQSSTVELGPGVTANHVARHNPEESFAKLMNAYEDRCKAVAEEVNRQVTIEVDRPDEPVVILVIGDMHFGSPSVNYPRLLYVMEQMQRTDIKVFGIWVGDCCDAMIWPGFRFEARSSPLSVHKEVLTAVWWQRQANKLGRNLGGVMGNHDLFSERLAGLSHFFFAMENGGPGVERIPIAKNELLLDITVRASGSTRGRDVQDAAGETYKWEIRHKVPGNSIYNRAHNFLRWNLFNPRDTEITCVGHVHKSGISHDHRHGKDRFGVLVGGYKVGRLDDYAVVEGFDQSINDPDVGVILWPNQHKIEVLETERAIRTAELEALAHRSGKSSTPSTFSSATERANSGTSSCTASLRTEGARRFSGARAARSGSTRSGSTGTKTATPAGTSRASSGCATRSSKRSGATTSSRSKRSPPPRSAARSTHLRGRRPHPAKGPKTNKATARRPSRRAGRKPGA